MYVQIFWDFKNLTRPFLVPSILDKAILTYNSQANKLPGTPRTGPHRWHGVNLHFKIQPVDNHQLLFQTNPWNWAVTKKMCHKVQSVFLWSFSLWFKNVATQASFKMLTCMCVCLCGECVEVRGHQRWAASVTKLSCRCSRFHSTHISGRRHKK